jgi:PAS domain S-box-containing protein/TyrR family helix-turn-helix protein
MNEKIDLDLVLDTIHDGVSVIDQSGIVRRVNISMTRITGLPPEVFVGQHIMSLYENGYFLEVPFAYRALKEAVTQHGIMKQSNGKVIMVSATPIMDQAGRVRYVVSDARDVTEMQYLREELEKTKQISKLYRNEFVRLTRESLLDNEIVVRSKEMLDVLDKAIRVGATDVTVMILGESGVGKEVVASVIHKSSPRFKTGPFLKLNCNTIPKELFESELLGYEKGAFTGAHRNGKPGLLDLAHGGTLFLDEIGDLPEEMQGKFLHLLEKQEYRRIGGTQNIKVDIRFITATNRDLRTLADQGSFRKDLYYRLTVVPIEVAPLRARPSDIVALLGTFIAQFNKKYKAQKSLAPDALRILQDYHWPGNVRELRNYVEGMVITTPHNLIVVEDLPKLGNLNIQGELVQKPQKSLREKVAVLERDVLLGAKKEYGSSRKIAKALDLSHTAVQKKLKKFKIVD